MLKFVNENFKPGVVKCYTFENNFPTCKIKHYYVKIKFFNVVIFVPENIGSTLELVSEY